MIQEFVDRFMEAKPQIETVFRKGFPADYKEIVRLVIENITVETYASPYDPDPERIVEIDQGDYQGTLVYVIGEKGYQPSDYWYVKVYYGSCSGCDTLEGIRCYDDGVPNDQQVEDLMMLALHIVQGLKQMGDAE